MHEAGHAPRRLDPSWSDVPIGDARQLGVRAGSFTRGLLDTPVIDGIRNNCIYELRTDTRIDKLPEATILVLSLESTTDALTIVDAEVVTTGRADEYQRHCFETWLTNQAVKVEGMQPGERFRVRFPIAM